MRYLWLHSDKVAIGSTSAGDGGRAFPIAQRSVCGRALASFRRRERCGDAESKVMQTPCDICVCSYRTPDNVLDASHRQKRNRGPSGTPAFLAGSILEPKILLCPTSIQAEVVRDLPQNSRRCCFFQVQQNRYSRRRLAERPRTVASQDVHSSPI